MIVCPGNAFVHCFNPSQYDYDRRQLYLMWFGFRCGDCTCDDAFKETETEVSYFNTFYDSMIFHEYIEGNMGSGQYEELTADASGPTLASPG